MNEPANDSRYVDTANDAEAIAFAKSSYERALERVFTTKREFVELDRFNAALRDLDAGSTVYLREVETRLGRGLVFRNVFERVVSDLRRTLVLLGEIQAALTRLGAASK